MFREGKIDEDTVDCPRFVAFKGASREHSSSSVNLGQLTKRIHGESDEFDEEEARQAQRKDRRRRAPFYLESPIGFTFTWNRPLCAVLMLLGGGGGGGHSANEERPSPGWCSFACNHWNSMCQPSKPSRSTHSHTSRTLMQEKHKEITPSQWHFPYFTENWLWRPEDELSYPYFPSK